MALQEEFEDQGNVLFKHRGTLPIIILVVGLLVFAYYDYVGQTIQNRGLEEIYKWISLGVCFLGLLIRVYTVGHSAKNTSGRNTQKQVADELNQTGIYSLVRHPLYVGNFFMWLGTAMLTQNFWFIFAFIFIYWVYYERIMYAEEQYLRKKFGQVYLDWAAQIPAFIFRTTGFTRPKYPFLWRKAIRQEKNGILAIFVIFFLFDSIGNYIRHQRFELEGNYWFFLFVGAGIYYLIIKILTKKTLILHDKA